MADQDNEIIDQNDIDKLLEASSIDTDVNDGIDDIGELSQDDIDALMDGGEVAEAPLNDTRDEEDYEYELDLISQDDINQIVNKKKEDALPSGNVENANEVEQAQEIKAPAEEFVAVNTGSEDGVIDESEAVSAEECFVTQDNIDQLLQESAEDIQSEETFNTEEPPVEQADEQDAEYQAGPETSFEEEPEPAEDFSQQETTTDHEEAMEDKGENMENPESNSVIVDLDDDEDLTQELNSIENEELQGDVDSLLDDPSEETDDDWEQDSLISQDDIEELIKSSENDDEDALGDLDSLGGEDGFDEDEFEDDLDEDEPEDEGSKVILEESENSSGEEDDTLPEEQKEKKKRSFKIGKKLVFILAAVLFFCAVLSAVWFFVLNKEKKPAPVKRKIVKENVLVDDTVVESVDIEVDNNPAKPKISKPMPVYSKSEPIVMKGFIVLAPSAIEGLSYIEADISIDYSNDNAYDEISNNMPFYRDIIYSAVQKALGSAKGDKITEPDLLLIIFNALKEAMPEGSIKKVSFKSFKAG